MKPIFNALSPFFDNEGKLLTAGRVMFCALGSDSELIHVTDLDGVSLPNPLPLNDCGRFADGLQPFVGDYTSYTAYVQKRTANAVKTEDGYDDNPAWETIYYFDVVGEEKHNGINASEVFSVGNIADLRYVNPSEHDVVLLLGYYKAGDCPAKVFSWVKGAALNNDGTNITSAIDRQGYWRMEKGSTSTLNWGIFQNKGEDKTELLRNCFGAMTSDYAPLVVASGVYEISSNLALNYEMHLNDNAKFKCIAEDGNVTLFVQKLECSRKSVNFIENLENSNFVLPCLGEGILHTEIFGGNISLLYNNQLVMRNLDELHYGLNIGEHLNVIDGNYIAKPIQFGEKLQRITYPYITGGVVEKLCEVNCLEQSFKRDVAFGGEVSFKKDVNFNETTNLNNIVVAGSSRFEGLNRFVGNSSFATASFGKSTFTAGADFPNGFKAILGGSIDDYRFNVAVYNDNGKSLGRVTTDNVVADLLVSKRDVSQNFSFIAAKQWQVEVKSVGGFNVLHADDNVNLDEYWNDSFENSFLIVMNVSKEHEREGITVSHKTFNRKSQAGGYTTEWANKTYTLKMRESLVFIGHYDHLGEAGDNRVVYWSPLQDKDKLGDAGN